MMSPRPPLVAEEGVPPAAPLGGVAQRQRYSPPVLRCIRRQFIKQNG